MSNASEKEPPPSPPEKTVSRTTFIVAIVVAAVVVGGVAFVMNAQLSSQQAAFNANYSYMRSLVTTLETSLNNLQNSYDILSANHETLSDDYSELQSSKNALQSSYNAMSYNYTACRQSLGSCEFFYSELEEAYNELYQIVELQMSTDLETNRPDNIPGHSVGGDSYITRSYYTQYAGYCTISLTSSTTNVYFVVRYQSYTYRMVSGTAMSGSYTFPVLPGMNYIEIHNADYWGNPTSLTYSLVYVY